MPHAVVIFTLYYPPAPHKKVSRERVRETKKEGEKSFSFVFVKKLYSELKTVNLYARGNDNPRNLCAAYYATAAQFLRYLHAAEALISALSCGSSSDIPFHEALAFYILFYPACDFFRHSVYEVKPRHIEQIIIL